MTEGTGQWRPRKMRKGRPSLAGLLVGFVILAGSLDHAAADEPTWSCDRLAFFCEQPWWTYWQQQDSRSFVSVDVGIGAYEQARSIIGYGKPFWMFSGLELYGATSPEFAAWSVGPRIDLIALNASFNYRRTHAYTRERPPLADTYDTLQMVPKTPHPNRYSSLDGWLWGYVPAGPTLTYWEVSGVYLLKDPGERAIFEEYHRFTINRRTALSLRAVLWLSLLKSSLNIGPAVDAVLSPSRSALVRAGGSLVLRFTEHIDFQMVLTAPIVSPDDLDWITQSWGSLSVGYAFATGESRPGL